jgi:enoyl-CoA hydratase/carnithine racemase
MTPSDPSVAIRIEGHVAVVTFQRPPNNHVTVEAMRALADVFDYVDGETNLRASVLRTGGKVFCAGADLVAAGRAPATTPVASTPGVNPLYSEAVRLFAIKKPIVAAVQGAAVGAGLGLALVADFRVAAPEARFAANFVKLGFHPGFGITHTLPMVIGWQKAQLLCSTGRRLTGEEALAWGLVDALAPLEDLEAATLRLAAEIAENAPLAVQATRATFRADLAAAVRAQTNHENAEQGRLRKTKDYTEGVRAVAERRPGNFVGA